MMKRAHARKASRQRWIELGRETRGFTLLTKFAIDPRDLRGIVVAGRRDHFVDRMSMFDDTASLYMTLKLRSRDKVSQRRNEPS
jgi:hypothetical protein